MNNILSVSFFFLYFASSIAADALPEVRNTDIEYSSPKAAYFRQARYGVEVRMALLKWLLA